MERVITTSKITVGYLLLAIGLFGLIMPIIPGLLLIVLSLNLIIYDKFFGKRLVIKLVSVIDKANSKPLNKLITKLNIRNLL